MRWKFECVVKIHYDIICFTTYCGVMRQEKIKKMKDNCCVKIMISDNLAISC